MGEIKMPEKKEKPKLYKITLASKYPDCISRFILPFDRKYTEGGMNKYQKEVDVELKPISSGTTNSLLVNQKGLPWGTYTYLVGDKVRRANPDAEDFVSLEEFFTAIVKKNKTRLMRADIKIIVSDDDVRSAIAEVMEYNPGILDNRNFVNDNVLKQLDFDISTSIKPIIKDQEIKSMADIEKKLGEASDKAKNAISIEV
jgi:hypothetical protein